MGGILDDPDYWRRMGGILAGLGGDFELQSPGLGGNDIGLGMVPRGGFAPVPMAGKKSPLDLRQTGWTFKDVKHPNKIMERGDHRKVTHATNTGEGIIEAELPIRSLNATQDKVNPDFASVKGGDTGNGLPFVIKKNGEYFVQDGHHRLTAASYRGKQTAKVRLLDLDGTTQTDFPLIDLMNSAVSK